MQLWRMTTEEEKEAWYAPSGEELSGAEKVAEYLSKLPLGGSKGKFLAEAPAIWVGMEVEIQRFGKVDEWARAVITAQLGLSLCRLRFASGEVEDLDLLKERARWVVPNIAQDESQPAEEVRKKKVPPKPREKKEKSKMKEGKEKKEKSAKQEEKEKSAKQEEKEKSAKQEEKEKQKKKQKKEKLEKPQKQEEKIVQRAKPGPKPKSERGEPKVASATTKQKRQETGASQAGEVLPEPKSRGTKKVKVAKEAPERRSFPSFESRAKGSKSRKLLGEIIDLRAYLREVCERGAKILEGNTGETAEEIASALEVVNSSLLDLERNVDPEKECETREQLTENVLGNFPLKVDTVKKGWLVRFVYHLVGERAGECEVKFTNRREQRAMGLFEFGQKNEAFHYPLDETDDSWVFFKCQDTIETIENYLDDLDITPPPQ